MADKAVTIGALAKATGTNVETIRYYERIGLLPQPLRTAGNYRHYQPGDLVKLGFIRRSRELGFSLDAIRGLLHLAEDEDRDCAAVDQIARVHVEEIERKIADLTALRAELRHIIGQCSRGTIAECRILEALSQKDATSTAM
jgi:Cu(I)-responsive transcriptional regulator